MAQLTETVNFRLTLEEKELWLTYCTSVSRTQNDVFREYLRNLAQKLPKKE
ncbi:MAG: hypothetical protein KME54_00840 [Tolypothrix brevis GSE-NOS-MK-07-07A]|jgi:predicted ferric reductase|nr:hypothetical protein [Tolypothrix brevis GSE-NOS-MK-07-07A]